MNPSADPMPPSMPAPTLAPPQGYVQKQIKVKDFKYESTPYVWLGANPTWTLLTSFRIAYPIMNSSNPMPTTPDQFIYKFDDSSIDYAPNQDIWVAGPAQQSIMGRIGNMFAYPSATNSVPTNTGGKSRRRPRRNNRRTRSHR